MSQPIRTVDTGLYVSNHGEVRSPVFLTEEPVELQFSHRVSPPGTVATIKGEHGLYINLGPPGVGYLVWSKEPREWKFEFTFRGVQISTLYQDDETLYWGYSPGGSDEKKIYLNPYKARFFSV